MGSWLSEREQRLVAGAETASAATPIPTQIVSNGEYLPPPQSETQKRVERRIFELADVNGKRLGLSRRQFMQTSCGMAAAFVAMNEVYATNVFQVAAAEAHEPELMRARAQSLAGQFIFDVQTHFVRDDFEHTELLGLAKFAADRPNGIAGNRRIAGRGSGDTIYANTRCARSASSAAKSRRQRFVITSSRTMATSTNSGSARS